MNRYLYYVFAVLGVVLAYFHPYAGASISLGSFAYGGFIRWIEMVDSAAETKLRLLGEVVNSNAQKLETVLIEFQKIQGEFSMSQQMKAIVR